MDKQFGFGQLNNNANVGAGAAMPQMQQATPEPVTPPPVTMPSQPSIPVATPAPAPEPVVTTSAQPMFGAPAGAATVTDPAVGAATGEAFSSETLSSRPSLRGSDALTLPVGRAGSLGETSSVAAPVAASPVAGTAGPFGGTAPAPQPAFTPSPVTASAPGPAPAMPGAKKSFLDVLSEKTGIEWNKANKILLILTIALAVGLIVALIYIIGFSGKSSSSANNTSNVANSNATETTTSSNLQTVSCTASGDWYDLTQDFVINNLAKETVRTSIMIDADTARSASFSEENEDDAMIVSLLEMLSTTLAGFAGEPGVTFVTSSDGATYWNTDFSVTRSDNMSEELTNFAVIDGYTAEELLGVVSQSGSLAELGMTCAVE